jgi:hypothetical protein
MGLYYRGKNSESAADLWIKKNIYTSEMQLQQLSYPNFVNFNLGEKFLYGRVSRLFVPIVTISPGTYLPKGAMVPQRAQAQNHQPMFKYIKQSATDSNSQFKALNFVVDAFQDVSAEFEKARAKGQISSDDKHLSKLVVSKAYEDPYRYYGIYKDTYFKAIAKIMIKNNTKNENITDFMSNFYEILSQTCQSVPFTFGSFIKSRRCPINVSGLVIEIATADSADDQNKIDSFVNSPNWKFYLNVCKQYGFMVDQSEPWRLVADIGSPQMLAYSARYGATFTDQILSTYYTPCYTKYYSKFSKDLLSLYDLCTQQPIMESEMCGSRAIMSTKLPTQYKNALECYSEFSEEEFLKLYFQIRLIEEETEHTEAEKEKLINQAMTWVKFQKSGTRRLSAYQKSVKVFETYANKPFDYRGSLTYNNNEHIPAYRAKEQELDDTGDLVIVPGSQTTSEGGGY